LERSHSPQKLIAGQSANEQLQRYLPEAIAETIRKDPQAADPFIPSVKKLLDSPDPNVRFGAACALAEHSFVDDPRIAQELTAGLENLPDSAGRHPANESLKQLMAVETIQRI